MQSIVEYIFFIVLNKKLLFLLQALNHARKYNKLVSI